MFFPQPMTKVRVLTARKDAGKAAEALYDFGMVHVVAAKSLKPGQPLASFRDFSEKLVPLRSLCAALNLQPVPASRPLDPMELHERFSRANVEEALSFVRQIVEFESKLASLQSELDALKPFRNLPISGRTLMQSQRVKAVYFQPKPSWSSSVLKKIAHEELAVRDEKDTFVMIAYDARTTGVVESITPHAIRFLDFPARTDEFGKAYAHVLVQVENTKASLHATQTLLSNYKKRHAHALSELLGELELSTKQAELPLRFGQSGQLCAAEGWVPTARVADLEKTVSKKLGGPVVIETLKTSDTPPTKLDNPKPIQPFEFLVQALSPPNYRELDPTLLIFLTFPLFSGMILGDIGYGLAMAAIALYLRQTSKGGFMRALSTMMFITAAWTTAFGMVFGEFLGGETLFGWPLHPFIARLETEGLMHLMQLSLLFGFIHLTIGFFLGAVVARREGHMKHAAAKASWLVLLVALVGFLSASAGIEALNVFRPIANVLGGNWLYVIGLSILSLLFTEGFTALFELPGLVSNLVSYLRIMAVGVSGVVLSSMVNKIPLHPTLDPVGLIGFVVFFLAFLLGQVFALVLGIFESSIQSIRLHYVEFFSKFYHGGGIAFTPLREVSHTKLEVKK